MAHRSRPGSLSGLPSETKVVFREEGQGVEGLFGVA